MRFQHTCAAAFMGLISLASSAPSPKDGALSPPAGRGLRWKSRAQKRAPLIVQQVVEETNIILIQDNQAELDALKQVAEQQFAQLVQAELALVTQLQTIKNNIRVNHFKARFLQANTVIVTVTTLVDARPGSDGQKRYMVNHLLADNGKPDQAVTVMVSDAATMTVGASAAASNLAGVAQASAVPTPTAAAAPAVFQGADPAAPFGQVNQSLIMAAGSAAPAVDVVFADPAAIVLPGRADLFVEGTATFLQDCGFYQANANAFLDLGAGVFTSFQEISVVGGGASVSIIQQQKGSAAVVVGGGAPAPAPVAAAPPVPAAPEQAPAEAAASAPPAAVEATTPAPEVAPAPEASPAPAPEAAPAPAPAPAPEAAPAPAAEPAPAAMRA
ncbi:hypothetical protein F4809DRAFT_665558 [Biscogniauxia mediterranea]|nr:hypothetical protein F4809DRAFT_665558 [Biscogniauxia mediterranea]